MLIRIAKPEEHEAVKEMDGNCFPEDEPIILKHGDIIWIAKENKANVGYAILTPVRDYREGYLSRVGVMPKSRGRGLHTRMIQERVTHAKKIGMHRLVTYTAVYNTASANNLFDCGFRLFTPDFKWSSKEFLWLELRL